MHADTNDVSTLAFYPPRRYATVREYGIGQWGTGRTRTGVITVRSPPTFEDLLLDEHFKTHPGTAYLELKVGLSSELAHARRIDAVLVPGEETQVYGPGDYRHADAVEAIRQRRVHIIEAKRKLNRGVIGQVLVGKYLVERALEPSEVIMDVVCAEENPDLRQFCGAEGIDVHLYPISQDDEPPVDENGGRLDRRLDVRCPPDEARRRAFLAGWTDAVNGQLYDSVQHHKTHQNMGNLFGWIYGDMPRKFRVETWARYEQTLTLREDEEPDD